MNNKTDRKLMQQALEALSMPCDRWNSTQLKIVNDAITALRNALAEQPAEQQREWQGLTEDKLLATFQNLRDESHTIQGASDDYKQGREMGIQICINELLRGEK